MENSNRITDSSPWCSELVNSCYYSVQSVDALLGMARIFRDEILKKKIAKMLSLEKFSKILANHYLFICAFGGEKQFIGNVEKILEILSKTFYDNC